MLDVNTLLKTPQIDSRKKQTDFIAVRRGQEVVGFTVYQLDRRKLGEIVRKEMESGKYNDESEVLRKMRADYVTHVSNTIRFSDLKPGVADEIKQWIFENLGIKLRFVPNRKKGYYYHDGLFLKKSD